VLTPLADGLPVRARVTPTSMVERNANSSSRARVELEVPPEASSAEQTSIIALRGLTVFAAISGPESRR
jgi:hypothetical protein